MTGGTTLIDDPDVARDTAAAAAASLPPLLVIEPLKRYLDSMGITGGALSWRRIGDGQANITYELNRGGRRVVLRRGPRPPFPPSAHDMLREARVVGALRAVGQPVPHIRAVCTDDSVIGAPFYVMDYLEGVVVTDALPPGFEGAETVTTMVYAAVDALADLHAVALEGAVAGLGRPDGYLERQVRRFADLWPGNTVRDLPVVERVGDRLKATLPRTARSSVVHGDYRLGNLMYAAPDRLLAILDWEMATLGDPLADLGYLMATYTEAGAARTPMDLTPVTAGEGMPTRREIADRYAVRTGADLSALAWYEAFALWKSAIFCEAIRTRWLAGEREGDAFAPTLTEGVPVLAAAADEALTRVEEGAT